MGGQRARGRRRCAMEHCNARALQRSTQVQLAGSVRAAPSQPVPIEAYRYYIVATAGCSWLCALLAAGARIGSAKTSAERGDVRQRTRAIAQEASDASRRQAVCGAGWRAPKLRTFDRQNVSHLPSHPADRSLFGYTSYFQVVELYSTVVRCILC